MTTNGSKKLVIILLSAMGGLIASMGIGFFVYVERKNEQDHFGIKEDITGMEFDFRADRRSLQDTLIILENIRTRLIKVEGTVDEIRSAIFQLKGSMEGKTP